ncbi:MAG: response regulator [Kiritimatiellaeota bacterium]|nr:response regulator [Kiritimatiellota bacterium]
METDPELIDQFVAEATELLTTAEEDVLALEESGAGADPALIDRLFRALHTVKGGAGLLGFTTFARLGHAMEDVVGSLRAGKLQPGAEVSDPLLRGIDRLRTFLADLQNDSVDISDELQRLEAVLGAGDQGQEEATAADEASSTDADTLRDFLGDANEQVMAAADALSTLEEAKGADVQSAAGELAAILKNMVTGAQKCGLTRIADLAAALAGLAELVRDGQSPVDDEVLGAAYAGLDALRMLLFSPEDDEIPISDELAKLKELTEKRSVRAGPGEVSSGPPASESSSPSASPPADVPGEVQTPVPSKAPASAVEAPVQAGGDAQAQSIRIPITLLDRLMNLATELVLVRNQNIQAVQAKDIAELRSISQRLNVVTSDLQATIMQTRMRPVSTVFARFKRVIHDLGRQLGKKIEPVFSGGEVELDKNILEAIADPLLHLVRNAADHGIESPEERIAKDKRPTGRLRIKASHRGDQVHIEVSDDGRGMDADELRKAAVRKGMLTEQEAAELSEREAFSLVFEPGFSTSEVVTDLSGRGVGMDVVKACIQRIGGSAEITSTPGRGTTVTVRLPLTLAIIPALIVRAGDACLAIPQTKIKEVVWLQGPTVADAIQKVDRQEVYWLRGQLLPIVRLENVLESSFGEEAEEEDEGPPVTALLPKAQRTEQGDVVAEQAGPTEQQDVHIVVVRAGAEQFGLLVNEIVDTEEIVVKGLHHQIKDCDAFAGATVLGDGRIALIVDVAAIAQLSALRFAEGQETVVGQRSPTLEPRTILLFDVGTQELFAIPLCLIIRVEEVPVDRIQTANGREYLEFRGAPIPLIRLEEIVQGLAPRYPDGALYAIIPKSSRPFGILASRIIDNVEMPPQADLQAMKRPGITGSQLIDGRLSLMLDVYGIIETVYPGWLPIEEGLAGKRILIADDSPFSRLLLASYLSGTGLEIEFASDGREALHAIRQKAFDLVISDLEMPRMDGLELAHALARDRRFASLPLLAVTGLRAGVREAALDAGFWDCKSKSDREGVLEAVLKCCSPDVAAPVKQS